MLPILYKIIVYVIASASGEKKPLPTEESRVKKTEWRHWQIITTLGRQWQESKAIYSWVVSLRTTWHA